MSDQPPAQPPWQPPIQPPTQPPTQPPWQSPHTEPQPPAQEGPTPSFTTPPLSAPGQFSSSPPPAAVSLYGANPTAPSSAASTSGANGTATAALVTGIVSLFLFWLCGLGALLGILAVALGIVGLSNSKKLIDNRGKGQAIAGIVTGSLAVLATIAVFAFFFLLGAVGSGSVDYGVNSGANTDIPDGVCDAARYVRDPDC
ncbi:protein of unknown function (DUF4190) [Actinobacteria bacterium IMCC26207]|nr:protein of unknown function (DUF4190) [Actinobacteria bacterium IMCC26207]